MSSHMRSHPKFLLLLILCFCLPVVAQEPQAAKPSTSKLEQRLRERCDGVYTALQNSQWRKVMSFLNEDAKLAWAPMKKIAIYGFTIKSVSVTEDGKTGITETMVDTPVPPPFPGGRITLPQTLEWAWEDGDWYVLLKGSPPPLPVSPGPDGSLPLPAMAPAKSSAPAELEFTNTVYDFKLLRQGEPIRAKFWFTNKSDHVVKAKAAVNNSCQCLSARMSQEQFKPGEEGWVEATMDSKLFARNLIQGLEVNLEPSGAKVLLQIRGYVLLPEQNRDQK